MKYTNNDLNAVFAGWEERDEALSVDQAAFAAHPRTYGCGHIKVTPLLHGFVPLCA